MVGPRITARANPRIRSLAEVFELTIADMNRVTGQVDRQFVANEKRLFATEGSSGGKKWKPLSPKSAKAKRRRYPGRKIMQRTGQLRKGLTTKSHPDHVARHANNKIKIGVRNPVAAYHGAVRGLGNPRLPVRNVMQMTVKQRRMYYRTVSDYLVNVKLKRAQRALAAGAAFMKGGRGGL